MGCCTSSLKTSGYIETPFEEKMIQQNEQLLMFHQKKLEDLLVSFDGLDFPLDSSHLSELFHVLQVPSSGNTAVFIEKIVEKGLMSIHLLRNISILVCSDYSVSKVLLFASEDKAVFLQNIQDLIMTAVEIIPKNLGNADESVLAYANRLKVRAEDYFEEMKKLTVKEIMEKLKELEITSFNLRLMLNNCILSNHETSKNTEKIDKTDASVYKYDVKQDLFSEMDLNKIPDIEESFFEFYEKNCLNDEDSVFNEISESPLVSFINSETTFTQICNQKKSYKEEIIKNDFEAINEQELVSEIKEEFELFKPTEDSAEVLHKEEENNQTKFKLPSMKESRIGLVKDNKPSPNKETSEKEPLTSPNKDTTKPEKEFITTPNKETYSEKESKIKGFKPVNSLESSPKHSALKAENYSSLKKTEESKLRKNIHSNTHITEKKN